MNYKAESVIFEDPSGFLSAYADKYDEEKILKNLGKEWVIANNSIKPYPCCARIHSVVNAFLEILKGKNIEPEQVESIEAEINTTDYEELGVGEDSDKHPSSVAEAQFSVHFALAAALANNCLTLDEYTDRYVKLGNWKKYMHLVSLKTNKEFDKVYPELWPALITVALKDGTRYKQYIEHTIGKPENPFTWDAECEKFRSLVYEIYSDKRIEQITSFIRNLDKIDNVGELFGILKNDK